MPLEICFKSCFVCGNKKYEEFYDEGNLYRICKKCLKKRKVKTFFRRGQKGVMWSWE